MGEKGVAFLLDLSGRITEVIRDDLGMVAGRLDGEGRFAGAPPLFFDLVQEGSRDKARSFLEIIRAEGVAFQWEFIVESFVDEGRLSRAYHFAGGMLCNQIIVLGACTPDTMTKFYHEFITLTLEQAAQLRQAMNATAPPRPTRPAREQNESLYEEFSRLNNELVNAQRALHKKNSELERLNSEKNLFIGMAAHDLRNPLGIIHAYGEFIGEALGHECNTLDREECESMLEMIQTIKDSSGFMLNMVDELLNVSRIEAGHIELTLQEVDLVSLFEHHVTLNKVLAEQNNVSVEFLTEGSLPRTVVDPNKMTQVLNNLIGNAVRHSPPGGRVLVRLVRNKDHVLLTIADQGEGVAESDRAAIFQPYVQLRKGGKGKGAGLGLAIVKRIVEGHGGSIWVTGKQGEGAIFNVLFPLCPARESVEGDALSEDSTTQKEAAGTDEAAITLRILVADDELLNRTLIERILTSRGHEVFTAEDG
ncbi:MAG: ATP-binding protein, partial [Oceanidesulfovibrio sp.]